MLFIKIVCKKLQDLLIIGNFIYLFIYLFIQFFNLSNINRNMSIDEALKDLLQRISNYEKVYETITDDSLSYIKLINLQSKVSFFFHFFLSFIFFLFISLFSFSMPLKLGHL